MNLFMRNHLEDNGQMGTTPRNPPVAKAFACKFGSHAMCSAVGSNPCSCTIGRRGFVPLGRNSKVTAYKQRTWYRAGSCPVVSVRLGIKDPVSLVEKNRAKSSRK